MSELSAIRCSVSIIAKNNPKICCTNHTISDSFLLPLTRLNKMNTGKVKFYNETKGYGFIVDDNTQEEYFTHATGLIDKVQENDSVEYELEEGRKGLNAINVKVIK